MPPTTHDAALIRDLPVSVETPTADVLGDALADAVSAAPLAVDWDADGPAGFPRVYSPGHRFQTWPAAVVPAAHGLWDRLAAPEDPAGDPLISGPLALEPSPTLSTSAVGVALPDAEVFVPDDAPVAPAGGDVPWPGGLP